MPEKLKIVADNADAIYNGYAFTRDADNIRVLNLGADGHAAVITASGDVLETSMDDIELALMLGYYGRVAEYMED